ncbi:synaptic vesicle glycoprotein 2B-like isoform X1 [Euwallacea similis]|uniref:synaptic vesicle glycoprotein 2B-like isoform X1 n=2 Tax=Euwallacea similis TaxID=1736056 RepID=UPI00344E447D
MCEESTCLVSPLEPAANGPNENRHTSRNNGNNALMGFHEDALSQATMGKAQIMLVVVLGLALAADCIEVKIISFILPAAELHLCIEERKKGWLVSITLLAMACGSFAWGILADHIGRKKGLALALIVAIMFAAAASVMPTYGTFMTARFGSGLGISGAFPIAFSFMTETSSRSSRAKYTGMLHSLWPLGAAYIAIVFEIAMPTLGADIVKDNKEHWSSWHRFLLLSVIPAAASIVGLIWTSESPRYLLEASREVEALAVYQRLHKLNKTKTQYGLTELELPGRSSYPEPALSNTRGVFAHGFDSVMQVFYKIFSPIYFKTTIILAILHLICGFASMGVSTFSTSMIKELREWEYLEQKRFVENQSFSGFYNDSLENVFFKDCTFHDCVFSQMNLVHVNFWNCTIRKSKFFNVKTSILSIENSVVADSQFIDTDLMPHHFINCHLTNNTFLSLISNCAVDFDYNIYLDDLRREIEIGSILMVPVLLGTGLILAKNLLSRSRILVVLWAVTCQTSLGILVFNYNFLLFSVIALALQLLLNAVLTVITLVVLEAYPCYIRCSAHGLMRSLYHIASFCSIPIYSMLTGSALIFPAFVTAFPCFVAVLLSFKIEDNSQALL